MSDDSLQPYVIIDRTETPAPRRWTVLRGRKPAVLLIDRGGAEGAGLDLPLAAEGFDVYRTTGRESALELLDAHPSVLMALVRLDLPDVDGVSLLRDLRTVSPGLWTGMLCDPLDKTRIAEGYRAGATDVLLSSAPRPHTIARLVRSVPWAARLRAEAERRRRRKPVPWTRRAARRFAPWAATLAIALSAGVALAAMTRAWQKSGEEENSRVERLLSVLESYRPASDRIDHQIDRWQRQEQLDLQRRSQESAGDYYRAQLEQDRLRDLLRFAVPRYPRE